MGEVARLCVSFNYEDEWPVRVGELIIYLSQWYAAQPALHNQSAAEIASFLDNVLFDEGLIHEICSVTINADLAVDTLHTVNASIVYSDLCSALARAAFERYLLPEIKRGHIAA